MKVRPSTSTACPRVARDPREDPINARSYIRQLSRGSIVCVIPRARVSDEDGVRSCLAMRVG
eukprot:1810395-Pleurochrysis_carterae.AAC.1